MIRTAVALSAVACVTSLVALANERMRPIPIHTCEHRLSQFVREPMPSLKGAVVDEAEAWVNFDARME